MAKKSKKKQLNPLVKTELIGLCYLVISILFILGLGVLSRLLSSVLVFLIGDIAYLVYIYALIGGLFIMIGKKTLYFTLTQIIAIIMFFVALLVLYSTLTYRDLDFVDYFAVLFDNLKDYVRTGDFNFVGGGVIGYFFSDLLTYLLSFIGVIIITIAVMIGAVILYLQKPLKSFFNNKGGKNKKGGSSKDKQPKQKAKKQSKLASKATTVKKNVPIFNFNEQEATQQQDQDYVETLINDHALEVVEIETRTPGVEEVYRDDSKYVLPSLELLKSSPNKVSNEDNLALKNKADILISTLKEFNVYANIVAINVGPTVTQFEIEIQAGTKLSKVKGLSGEIALALAAKDVRIQAPIPQKSTVGIEIPNDQASLVTLKEILKAIPKNRVNKTIFGLGKDIMGHPVYAELNKMPHLLVAGATGSGKSVCINSIIISIAMRAKPSEVKILMIDPKKVELGSYNGLPHLLAPVVTNPKKAATALQKIVSEMEHRYDLFSEANCKNIESYNQKLANKNLEAAKLPYIVVIVDELADLMLVASKEVEDAIMRLTQMARAAGIHLIVATQRPSTDIITGVIKANIPSRIAFGVSSSIDSRTILDSVGAEKLLGRGDMLFVQTGSNLQQRIQGAYISEEEVESIVNYCAKQQIAQFDQNLIELESTSTENKVSEDELYNEVLEFVLDNGNASTSLLQRRFRIGYNRASRLIDDLENNGIIGSQNGSKPRDVIIDL